MMDMEDEEDEDEEGEESEEEAPPPSNKRKAEGSPAQSPAKKPATGGGSASADGYVKQIQDFLKKNGGKSKLGMIGSKVPRPKDQPKLKAFFEQHKDKFVVKGE